MKLFTTLTAIVRKNWNTDKEFIDIDSFADIPGEALLKSHSAIKNKGENWACENPISRTIVVTVKES